MFSEILDLSLNLSIFDVYLTVSANKKVVVEMPGIEPGAFHMQSERSTTELHPHF